jgi:small-conductance mechanosensitive channel
MSELSQILPSWDAAWYWLRQPSTLWQAGIIGTCGLLAWLIGSYVQTRLQPVLRPGAIAEGPRTAVRTWALALIPLILWLCLLTATTVFQRMSLPTDLLRPAMVLAGAMVLIRAGVFVLRHTLSPGSRLKAWEGVLTAGIWLLVALHILGWLPHIEQALDEYAVTIGAVRVSILTVVSFVLSIIMLMFVALGLTNALQWRVMKSQALDENLKIALVKLGKFLLLSLAILTALLASGIDITALAVFGGALGVGLGLGLQRVVSNFVSGVILAFEGSIRLGDVVTVGKAYGIVKEMHARHIVVHTREGLDILVPNESLLTGEITNWSYDDRKVRLGLPVQISYQDDPEAVIALLERVTLQHPRVLRDPPPAGQLKGFGENGIDLELRLWVDDPEHGTGNVRSEVNRAIWKALKEAGVTIPFPQRDLHVRDLPAAAKSRSPDT